MSMGPAARGQGASRGERVLGGVLGSGAPDAGLRRANAAGECRPEAVRVPDQWD